VPDRILRWRWPRERLLRAIEVFRFEQAPRFYVRTGRLSGELSMVGFNVFKLSPFKLALVGADLQISLDSRDFYDYRERVPAETPAGPYARSAFWFRGALTDGQVAHMRSYSGDWALIRIRGAVIVRSIFGDLRKDISADITAVIDR
jgi:hypothetical protein